MATTKKRRPTLRAVEQAVWDMRQGAFAHWGTVTSRTSTYERGLRWGVLSALDGVLDECRLAIDGVSGRGGTQMAKQRKRCA